MPYNTRSSSNYTIKEMKVEIDFDYASKAWRENKRELKNGMYSYKKTNKNCGHVCDNGKKCKKKRVFDSDFCELHYHHS